MVPLLLLLAAAIATPKSKMGPVEKERKMVVDAVRGCPEASDEDEIVICSNDRGISEGYRLPKLDPRFDMTLRQRERGGLADPGLGAGGVGSCSTTGAGGSTGCTLRGINNWAAEQRRKQAADRVFENPN